MIRVRTCRIASGVILLVLNSFTTPSHAQDWALKVQAGVDDDHPMSDQQRWVAERLTAAKMPPTQARLNQFSKEDGVFYPIVRGWHATIQKIEPIQGIGVIVLVRVSPDLNGTYDSHVCLERYLVTQHGVHFLGVSIPPPGTPRVLIQP